MPTRLQPKQTQLVTKKRFRVNICKNVPSDSLKQFCLIDAMENISIAMKSVTVSSHISLISPDEAAHQMPVRNLDDILSLEHLTRFLVAFDAYQKIIKMISELLKLSFLTGGSLSLWKNQKMHSILIKRQNATKNEKNQMPTTHHIQYHPKIYINL